MRAEGGTLLDIGKILDDLRQEREQLEDAFISLERLARGRGKRRGRPPAWLAEARERAGNPGPSSKTGTAGPKQSPL